MDAVEFLKAKNRMCREYSDLPEDCFACPIGNDGGGCQAGVFENQEVTEEELVSIVEKWAAEHPKKTRQSEFLKMYPDAEIENATPYIRPCYIDGIWSAEYCDNYTDCDECRAAYWNEEVE